MEEQSSDGRKNWVAEISVQWWHSARFDAALEPIAHYEIVAVAQFFQKARNIAKIVAAIWIAHDDVLAMGGSDTTHQSASVATSMDIYDSRSHSSSDLRRSVSASIVSYDDFAANVLILYCRLSLRDACAKGLGFVQTWHHHGQLRCPKVLSGLGFIERSRSHWYT